MTVFSFGAGQESIYLLHRFIYDQNFYRKWVKGPLLVVGSDTGNEHDHTYNAIRHMKHLCGLWGIKLNWVTPDMGFHPNTWQSLTYQYERNTTIGSAAYQQTCTENLKVKVVDKFVEKWLKETFGFTGERKKAYHEYMEAGNDQIRLIIGYAKGEEGRTKNGNKFDAVWKKKAMLRCFPLIEEGIDRQACIDYNEANILIPIFPSNCMMCFYQSDQEILWLHRNKPEIFKQWVEIERKKLEKYSTVENIKNFGVFGKITLTQKLDKAERLYGDWTDERLNEYKFSHGHCIKSKY